MREIQLPCSLLGEFKMVVVKRKSIDIESELVHHGIRGQRWGQRNGPPYPLGYSNHSTAEKRLNSKSLISGETWRKLGKAAVITAGAVTIGGIAYGAIKSGTLDNVIETGKAYVDQATRSTVNKEALGKSFDDIDREMVKQINEDLIGTNEGSKNCFLTSATYCNNSLFGHNDKALGLSTTIMKINGKDIEGYIDPNSGMFVAGGPSVDLYSKLYSGLNVTKCEGKSFNSVFTEIPKKSTGIMRIGKGGPDGAGHFVNYECDRKGRVTIVDTQNDMIIPATMFAKYSADRGWSPSHIVDFSNASINDGANFEKIGRKS